MQVSVIIPLYNEADSLSELIGEIHDVLASKYKYELILVDDGSNDNSWSVVCELVEKYKEVKGIRLLCNFGKSKALFIGLKHAKGKVIVTMDADLQDNPHVLLRMFKLQEEGYDIVNGWKKNRKDSLSKRIFSRVFNTIIRLISPLKLRDMNCGLKVFTAEVGRHITVRIGSHRYLPLLAYWLGFTKIAEIEVPHRKRKYGKSKYGISRLWKGSIDLIFLMFIRRYIEHPIYFFGFIGALFTIIGLTINIYLLILKFIYGIAIGHRPLIFLGLLLLVTGVQLFCTGLVVELLLRNRKENIDSSIREIIN